MRRKQPEFQLHCVVADYFRKAWPRLLWFHVGNGEKRNAITGSRLKRMGVRPGVADILIFWGYNKKAAIELKAAKNALEDTQEAFRDHWMETGGYYVVCRSLDDVIEQLKMWEVA